MSFPQHLSTRIATMLGSCPKWVLPLQVLTMTTRTLALHHQALTTTAQQQPAARSWSSPSNRPPNPSCPQSPAKNHTHNTTTMPPLVLLDFDATITNADTLDALVAAATAHRPASLPRLTPGTWNAVVDAYSADYDAHVAAYRPVEADRKTAEEELAFLESFKPVERASLARVGASGVFAGFGRGFFEGFGREAVGSGEVRVRDGFGGFAKEVMGKGGGVGVVSVNWSGEWVRGLVEAAGAGEGVGVRMVNGIRGPEGVIEGPKGFEGTLVTAGDKLLAARRLVREWREAGAGREGGWVYFGDSATDLGCLLEATLGIVMADGAESKMLKLLGRIGFDVPHVGSYVGEPGLVWARDYEEVVKSKVLDRVPWA